MAEWTAACAPSPIYHYPHTPEEIELTILNTQGHMRQRDNAADPWNPPGLPTEWLANPHNNPRRADWTNSLQHFSARWSRGNAGSRLWSKTASGELPGPEHPMLKPNLTSPPTLLVFPLYVKIALCDSALFLN